MSSSGNGECPTGGALPVTGLDDDAWLAWVRASESDPPLGRIGPYELIQEIGRGGQGLVFRARQPQTGREVAIKRLSAGVFATPDMRARFEREIEAAAALDHPNIVTVYGSELIDRQPLLVMRWVDGVPFDAWARPNGAAARAERDILATFLTICSAIEHAHQHGVIHRDLKPSNILVDHNDRPHVLDFGLAKVVDDGNSSRLTDTGVFMGTPAYAAPEVLRGQRRDIDVRSDVYSLGATLYQALTGQLPFDRSGGLYRLTEMVEHTPPRPTSINARLNREIDAILLKALAIEKELRYGSVESLRADIQRYLAGQPVLAHAPSLIYRTRKFLRSYWPIVTASTAFILLLAGFSAATWIQARHAEQLANSNEQLYVRAESARKDAEQRQMQTQQIADFQAEQFRAIDAPAMGVRIRADLLSEARATMERTALDESEIAARLDQLELVLASANLTNVALQQFGREIFEPAETAIDEKFADQPLIQAQLLQSMGSSLARLGLLERASRPQARALELRRKMLGDNHPDTLFSLGQMAGLLRQQGKLSEAEPHTREALERSRVVFGTESSQTATALCELGSLLREQGQLREAEERGREALDQYQRVLGNDHPFTLTAMENLGSSLRAQGKSAEAESLNHEVLAQRRRILGDDHPDTLRSMNALGVSLQDRGQSDEAEGLLRGALEKQRRLYGDRHPDTLTSIANFARLLAAQKKSRDAEALLREGLDASRNALGAFHPTTQQFVNAMGMILQEQGRLADAEPYVREAVDVRRRTLGEKHRDTLVSVNNLIALLIAQKKAAEAESLTRDALETSRRLFGPDHKYTKHFLHPLGSALQQQGKFVEAEPLLREALASYRQTFGDEHGNTISLIFKLAYNLEAQGKSEESTPLIEEAIAGSRRLLGPDHPQTLERLSDIGNLFRIIGKFDKAEPLLHEVLACRRRVFGDHDHRTVMAMATLATCLVAIGTPEAAARAEPILRECVEARRRLYPDGHPDVWVRHNSVSLLGAALALQAKFAEAEPLLLEAYLELKDDPRVPPPTPQGEDRRREALDRVVWLYEKWSAADAGQMHAKRVAEWRAVQAEYRASAQPAAHSANGMDTNERSERK